MNIIEKIKNNETVYFNTETKKYYNSNTYKWVAKLRPSAKGEAVGKAKGKAIGKSITKSKTNITISLEADVVKYVYTEFEHSRGARYCERVLFFLSHIRNIGNRNTWLREKATEKGYDLRMYFHAETGEERGVFVTSKQMKILFGSSYSNITEELMSINLIDTQEQLYQRTSTKHIKHYTYTPNQSKSLQSFIVNTK